MRVRHVGLAGLAALATTAWPGRADETAERKLHGRFLHITDLHYDHFYRPHTDTDTCHRGHGSAGVFGSPTEGCDSPAILMNATFEWIAKNVRDDVDFVIWTGDSARHDNDEVLPRSADQVRQQNSDVAAFFGQTFGDQSAGLDRYGGPNRFMIPIVPNLGNNDFLPHNIFTPGPNEWTEQYLHTWRSFVPEEQRHHFLRGGWFYVEVIPSRLAVFSLNTMFFFASNAAVDGCANPSEPGFEQLEWLRIQLQFLRRRNMKAILIGHVPPARTEGKTSWDETCWQKFTLWLHHFRDIIVSSHFGHMNIDHFIVHDTADLLPDTLRGRMDEEIWMDSADHDSDSDGEGPRRRVREPYPTDCLLWPSSANSYLSDLRSIWEKIPSIDHVCRLDNNNRPAVQSTCNAHFGGPDGDRYSLSFVSPSIIPTYFPSMRVYSYNISNIDQMPIVPLRANLDDSNLEPVELHSESKANKNKKNKKKKKKKRPSKPKKPKKPRPRKFPFTVPDPPQPESLPGPAHSAQLFSLTGYVQYFANISYYNHLADKSDKHKSTPSDKYIPNPVLSDRTDTPGLSARNKDHDDILANFTFEIEYSTFDDPIFNLNPFTIPSFLQLAHRVALPQPKLDSGPIPSENHAHVVDSPNLHQLVLAPNSLPSVDPADKGKKGKKGKGKKGKKKPGKKGNETWFYFVRRALVSTISPQNLRDRYF